MYEQVPTKGKVYAVAKGHKVGLFGTWAACEAAVKGFKGALFKSFKSRVETITYLEQNGIFFSDKPDKSLILPMPQLLQPLSQPQLTQEQQGFLWRDHLERCM